MVESGPLGGAASIPCGKLTDHTGRFDSLWTGLEERAPSAGECTFCAEARVVSKTLSRLDCSAIPQRNGSWSQRLPEDSGQVRDPCTLDPLAQRDSARPLNTNRSPVCSTAVV